MDYEVYYYSINGGDEWLEREFNEDDVRECHHYWRVKVEKVSSAISDCDCNGAPVVGEVVYCNGFGTVEILQIIEQVK